MYRVKIAAVAKAKNTHQPHKLMKGNGGRMRDGIEH
jgi:hypothetical protein